MAGVISTATHPKLLWPGINAIWGQWYNQHPPQYSDLYTEETSTQAYEQDVQTTGFGLAPVKAQGAPGTYDSTQQGFVTTYSHIAYALGYIVTYEELMDNLYKKVSEARAKSNAFSMAQTVETVAAFLYNNAFNSTYFTTGDGQPLISPAHVNATGGTFSNQLATNSDLCEAALEDLVTQIMLATDARGLRIALKPQTLHIHVSKWAEISRILDSALQSNTANNNINVLKSTNAFPGGVKINHYFTQPDAWFVRTNAPEGMKMFWRQKPELTQDNDFDTKNAKAMSYMRFSVGATDPLGIFGSNGA